MALSIEHRPGIPELARFRRNFIAYLDEMAATSVDVRHLRIVGRDAYLINNPDLYNDILIQQDWNFIKGRGLRNSKPMLGEGLLTSEGEVHRRQRRLAQPAFHSARLSGYAATMLDCTQQLLTRWQQLPILDIHQEMMRLTMQIVGRTLFGTDVLHQTQSVGHSMEEALQLFLQINHPLAQFFPPYYHYVVRKVHRARRKIAVVLETIIADHHANPDRYDDMLSMLMSSHDDNSYTRMSDELLLDESLTIFLAGHETTANALTWTWYCLSQNPNAEAAMHAELDAVLGTSAPALDDLQRLPVTTAVLHESMRLFPPAWVITREAVTPYEYDGLHIPAGANLIMSPYATHRDARFWPQPEQFRLDRWTPEAIKERPRFAFTPFGAGTRNCIGEHFARMEAVIVLATIAQHYSLALLPGQKVELWPQITLRPRHTLRFQRKLRRAAQPS